jgi:hypothetical protein
MAFRSKAPATSNLASHLKAGRSGYSYSLRRWSGFDAWQEHIRESALSVGNALSASRDRDLRRTVVAG